MILSIGFFLFSSFIYTVIILAFAFSIFTEQNVYPVLPFLLLVVKVLHLVSFTWVFLFQVLRPGSSPTSGGLGLLQWHCSSTSSLWAYLTSVRQGNRWGWIDAVGFLEISLIHDVRYKEQSLYFSHPFGNSASAIYAVIIMFSNLCSQPICLFIH
jgi:hypothetical protein